MSPFYPKVDRYDSAQLEYNPSKLYKVIIIFNYYKIIF